MTKPGRNNRRPRNETQPNSTLGERHYKGVRKRISGRWVSEIRFPRSRNKVWLGTHDTPEKAARAYDAAVYCLYGHTGKFNFPMVVPPPNVPLSRNLAYKEIQDIALSYANQTPVVLVTDGQQIQESVSSSTQVTNTPLQEP
ncbi:hypothetical protein ACHQM5_011129 [Ranunculus cassubicifolius]